MSLLSTPSSHNDSPTSRSMSRTEASDKENASEHVQANPSYCDQRLRHLDISFWTKVPISSRCAAHIISLYLETDHPLLGTFDPNMFVQDLTQCRYRLCSPFLVDALLFLASVGTLSPKPLRWMVDASRKDPTLERVPFA